MRNLICLATLTAVAFLCACAPKPPEQPPVPKLTLEPASFSDLPGWNSDDHDAALATFGQSCTKLARLSPEKQVGSDAAVRPAQDWIDVCTQLSLVRLAPGGARTFLETYFQPYAVGDNGKTEGLFTGYYEPLLKGSRTKSEHYATPLLMRPKDLVTIDLGEFRETLKGQRLAGRVVDGQLKPYPDRTTIENGALNGRDLELVWVDDPVGAFFLQIQGSGRVTLEDGTEMRVGYAAQNGHPYVAIGKVLKDMGELPAGGITMPTIKAWLAANPQRAAEVMNRNPSYVFFRELDGEGPIGAQGVALTPERSLAVDRKFLPYGVPLWLDVIDPLDQNARIQRLMIAQDTGGAIRGPVRGDVFWGHGEDAERRAGVMQSKGRYWVLLPKGKTS